VTARGARSGEADFGTEASILAEAPLLPVYARADVTFEQGDGVWLVADDGRRYLDFLAGIAVVGLGHRHPDVTAAAQTQLDRLWHASNLVWTRPMAELAERLSGRFGGAQAFFCNSGAEAVEAALKYARKATGRAGIVALENSFHGRTLGALSVTGQPSKRLAFEPLLPAVSFARLNDADSLRAACAEEPPGCIILEPVQGEGGILPATPEFLAAAADIASEAGALLALDEIQAGVGRTGTFFAFEQAGVKPDLVTLAKGLANGLPIGCLLVADRAAGAFAPGDHASTFGGNPVACAAACAVSDAVTDELLAHVRAVGAQLSTGLADLPAVHETRGLGLLLGAELDRPAADVVTACLRRGLLVSSAGERVLRLTPPLTVGTHEAEQALAILSDALA
jgi:acetylornithine/N-succinyldiaminopimelate aminotransferase